jgi:Zn-dependent alcohol dehydrogenase
MAKAFGATDVINGKETDAPSAIRELTGGLGVDYAFEVIGAAAVVSEAYNSLKRGGKVVVVGVPAMGTDFSIPGFGLVLEEKAVIGSLYGSGNLHRDMVKLIDLYMSKKLKIDELVSAHDQARRRQRRLRRDGKGRGRAFGDRVLTHVTAAQ